jgi:trehalose 6-phosphate phosphatase
MKVLNQELDLDRFFAQLREARERVLLLDYDGTLAPFHADPARALPYPEICTILRRIHALPNTRIALVSGRRLEDLEKARELVPHTDVWASHGWEWIVGGTPGRRVPAGDLRSELQHAAALVKQLQKWGLRIENKIASVAVHWRGLPPSTIRLMELSVRDAWRPIAGRNFVMQPFDGGIELRSRGHDKGDAVRTMLERCADATCAYLGDDTTDEDAFRAIHGHGLGVLVRQRPRQTLAQLWLEPPHGVAAFLERWAA